MQYIDKSSVVAVRLAAGVPQLTFSCLSDCIDNASLVAANHPVNGLALAALCHNPDAKPMQWRIRFPSSLLPFDGGRHHPVTSK